MNFLDSQRTPEDIRKAERQARRLKVIPIWIAAFGLMLTGCSLFMNTLIRLPELMENELVGEIINYYQSLPELLVGIVIGSAVTSFILSFIYSLFPR